MKKMNNKGFSLVELIIVIAIMAILIAVLAPQYIKYVEKSRKSADLDNYQKIIDAVQVAYSDTDLNLTVPSGGVTITLSSASGTATAISDTSLQGALENTGVDVTKIVTKSSAYKGKVIKVEDNSGNIKITVNDASLAGELGLKTTGTT